MRGSATGFKAGSTGFDDGILRDGKEIGEES